MQEYRCYFEPEVAKQTILPIGLGELQNKTIAVDANSFKLVMAALLAQEREVTCRSFFQAIHLGYAQCIGRYFGEDSPPPIIVNNFHNFDETPARMLTDYFPQTTFIQIVRSPLQSLSSIVRGYIPYTYELFQPNLRLIIEGGAPPLERYRRRAGVVRIEDLNADPRPIMQNVAAWLGLSWSDTLLESTFNGEKWSEHRDGSNSTSEPVIPPFDAFRLEYLMKEKYRAWNYPLLSPPHIDGAILSILFALPFHFEHLRAQEDSYNQQETAAFRAYFVDCFKRARNAENRSPAPLVCQLSKDGIVSWETG